MLNFEDNKFSINNKHGNNKAAFTVRHDDFNTQGKINGSRGGFQYSKLQKSSNYIFSLPMICNKKIFEAGLEQIFSFIHLYNKI